MTPREEASVPGKENPPPPPNQANAQRKGLTDVRQQVGHGDSAQTDLGKLGDVGSDSTQPRHMLKTELTGCFGAWLAEQRWHAACVPSVWSAREGNANGSKGEQVVGRLEGLT
jgi:hypothetical protein